MKEHWCVNQDGEAFVLFQDEEGLFLCPVCGSAEFDEAPYDENGLASFQMCSCGFEFGYDDTKLAAKDALEGMVLNWDRWRLKVINEKKHNASDLIALEASLKNIGYQLAFDLMPVKINGNT